MDRSPLASFCPSFRSAPAADQCHMSGPHRQTLDAILTSLEASQPILVLTGDPGTGKTTMAHQVAARCASLRPVGRIGHSAAHLADPAPHVPKALGLASDPSGGARAVLSACHASGSRHLLIVDEAQALTDTGLDYLAALTDAPTGESPVLSILLVGGRDLVSRLAQPKHETLRSRIGGRFQTVPLDAGETADYIAHRFRVSGCACHADIEVFDAAACACLHAMSGGVPRVINHLVQSCLFEAGTTGRRSMDAAFVQDCLSAMALDGRLGHLITPAALRQGAAAARAQHPVACPSPCVQSAPPAGAGAANGALPSGHWRGGLAAAVTGLLVLVPQGLRQPPFDAGSWASLLAFPAILSVPDSAPAETVPLRTAAAARIEGPAAAAAGISRGTVLAPSGPLPRQVRVEAVPDPSSLLAQALTVGAVDPDHAAQLYTRAALRGNGRAAYYLGQLYETGIGVDPDPYRARAWYQAATGIDGAALRLAQLVPVDHPGDPGQTAPVSMSHGLYESGQTELVWIPPAGSAMARFRVQFVPAGGDGTVRQRDTALSAMLVERPVTRWRVMALRADGTEGPASAWNRLAPPAR
ncbi:AAA family ATPase [Paracoccus subflavus]|uniref:AAA family ATPase n=2 Tax=Paracoccus subflavus TaxID=2528244 RepID=A0A4V2JBX2_9RHOB|nr:AAA family ATPase [Paracoccus subflavus]